MGDFGTVSTMPQGFLLGNRYEIRRIVGQGGMGIVYLALDKQLDDSPRAVKTIKPELLADPRGARQLKKEAKATLSLSHPNVVRVFHYEEWEGASYLVMEFIEGQTLAELLAEKEKLGVDEFLPIAGDICQALDYAHAQGIIHQDIKPSNIFVDADGEAKLSDFGIARVCKDTTTRLTGVVPSGTLVYMSPEMLRGGKPSFASDIYSLGITFYEMLTGEPPFIRGDIYRQHQEIAPAPIEGVDERISRPVLSGLAKEPSSRPESAAVLFAGLAGDAKVERPSFTVSKEPEDEYVDSAGMRFRLVPAGSFVMGSGSEEAFENEMPAHTVLLTRPFYMGVFPVTQEQFEQVMGNNPAEPKNPALPVNMITFEQAEAFCAKMSKEEGVTYRLPTEAEWEYAARAGTATDYYWGNKMDGRFAWYNGNSGGRMHPPGGKEPNRWGFHDMLGNILEWCSDWYSDDYYRHSTDRDPKGPLNGRYRVLRGGSSLYYPRFLRSASRFMIWLEKKADHIGFRCVRETGNL